MGNFVPWREATWALLPSGRSTVGSGARGVPFESPICREGVIYGVRELPAELSASAVRGGASLAG